MKVFCSNCSSQYKLTRSEINNLKHSVMECNHCHQHIKITFCPHCNAFYSITFNAMENLKYSLKCKKCFKPFMVVFPKIREAVKIEKDSVKIEINRADLSVETSEPPEPPKSPKGGLSCPSAMDGVDRKENIKSKFKSFNSTVRDKIISKNENRKNKIRVEPVVEKENKEDHYFKGKTLIKFSIKEFFTIGAASFSRKKIIVSVLGTTSLFAVLKLFSTMENLFFNNMSMSIGRAFVNLFPLGVIFYIYILIASLISMITMDEIFHGKSDITYGKVFKNLLSILKSVFIANILTLFVINLVIILFGQIPLIGPLFYSILFFPLYLISLFITILIVIGFWFYPPIIAYRKVGIYDNCVNLYHFVKKHNFTLVYIIPIISIISTLIFSGIYLIHKTGLYLSIIMSGDTSNSSILKIFSAIPSSLLNIANISFIGNDSTMFRSLMENVGFAHSTGGYIVGIVLSFISIFLIASFISIVSTFSTHLYIMMERGRNIDDQKKIRLLGILFLFLGVLLIVKKLFS